MRTAIRRRASGKVHQSLHGPFDPGDFLKQKVQTVHGERSRILRPDGGLKQEFHPGERVSDLVGDAGRELPDRRELFGAEQVPLLLLKSLAHRADPVDDPVELLVQVPEVGRPLDGHGPDILVQMGLDRLDPDGQLGPPGG